MENVFIYSFASALNVLKVVKIFLKLRNKRKMQGYENMYNIREACLLHFLNDDWVRDVPFVI